MNSIHQTAVRDIFSNRCSSVCVCVRPFVLLMSDKTNFFFSFFPLQISSSIIDSRSSLFQFAYCLYFAFFFFPFLFLCPFFLSTLHFSSLFFSSLLSSPPFCPFHFPTHSPPSLFSLSLSLSLHSLPVFHSIDTLTCSSSSSSSFSSVATSHAIPSPLPHPHRRNEPLSLTTLLSLSASHNFNN
ncbi:hypothetical protein BKA57DRAFT_111795 [Linnemannia elongata]|nr:hypothetical protein BKA57DRAFT_111795 [Linnemannia elongata]